MLFQLSGEIGCKPNPRDWEVRLSFLPSAREDKAEPCSWKPMRYESKKGEHYVSNVAITISINLESI